MDNIKGLYIKWKKNNTLENRDRLFEEIWYVYHSKLQVYTSQFSVNRSDSSDISSEILLKIFEIIDTYKTKYSFSTWIYRVARNYLIDSFRRKKLSLENMDDHILSNYETPESILLRNSEISSVQSAISELKPSDREIVYLYYYEELKQREIAKIIGKPLGTIKYRMSEIKKELNIDLSRRLNYAN